MHRKKELCRNYQRGSCQYGETCKFLHASQQQQPKPNPFGFSSQFQQSNQQQKPNPFGFGLQNNSQTGSQFQHINRQQQEPNPFGFGVRNSLQPKGASDFGSRQQHQFKPFENKWNRFSPTASANSNLSRPADNQLQAPNHICTDSEACKREIAEDFEHERPLWKLTCYGHSKHRPCDIVGDISPEELRAAAYDDAKRGLNLQSIVERERNLLGSKLIEFESLLRNPYVIPINSSDGIPGSLPGVRPNAPSVPVQSSSPPIVSSFSQLGSSLNVGPDMRPPSSSNNTFWQSSTQFSNLPSGAFGMTPPTFGNTGSVESPQRLQPSGRDSKSNFPTFSSSAMSSGSNIFSLPSASATQVPSSANKQSSTLSSRPSFTGNAVAQASAGTFSMDDKKENIPQDFSIWLKEKWLPGEIPEEAPPDEFI